VNLGARTNGVGQVSVVGSSAIVTWPSKPALSAEDRFVAPAATNEEPPHHHC